MNYIHPLRVPYVPSTPDRIVNMVELADIHNGDMSADLGSGDGRVVMEFAKHGAIAHGYEIEESLVFKSEENILEAELTENAFIHPENYWDVDLSSYNIITIYGMTTIMERLETKLLGELKPGSKIVSNFFKFPDLKPVKTKNNVYLYVIKY